MTKTTRLLLWTVLAVLCLMLAVALAVLVLAVLAL